ncbi:MAG: hypothetical protein ACOCXR_01015 [Phototrophicaceae bacterium]
MSENYTSDYDIHRDLKEAEAMARNLESYVKQDQLYGSAGASGFFSLSKLPSLTIGALLLRIRRLQALGDQLSDEQKERLETVVDQNNEVLRAWRVHYEKKMLREARSRLKAMDAFFEECRSDPKLCARVYGPEASRRTIVQEILSAMDELSVERDDELWALLNQADSRLRSYVRESGFIWDALLEPVYPRSTYWWLYSQPPG